MSADYSHIDKIIEAQWTCLSAQLGRRGISVVDSMDRALIGYVRALVSLKNIGHKIA